MYQVLSKSKEFKFGRSVNFDRISKAGNESNCEGNSSFIQFCV